MTMREAAKWEAILGAASVTGSDESGTGTVTGQVVAGCAQWAVAINTRNDMVRAEEGYAGKCDLLGRKWGQDSPKLRSQGCSKSIRLSKGPQRLEDQVSTCGWVLVWLGGFCSRRKLLVLKNKRSFRRKPGINKSDIGCWLFFFFWGGRVKYILIFRENMNCSKIWATDWPGDNSKLF